MFEYGTLKPHALIFLVTYAYDTYLNLNPMRATTTNTNICFVSYSSETLKKVTAILEMSFYTKGSNIKNKQATKNNYTY